MPLIRGSASIEPEGIRRRPNCQKEVTPEAIPRINDPTMHVDESRKEASDSVSKNTSGGKVRSSRPGFLTPPNRNPPPPIVFLDIE